METRVEKQHAELNQIFHLLTETMLEQEQGNCHLVVGDMITRMHARLPHEGEILAPYLAGEMKF